MCTDARWYLLAWDVRRADWRTFRVDRIGGTPATGARFLPRKVPGGDAAAYVSRSISVTPYPAKAEIVLHAPLATMRERIPPSVGRLQRIDDDHCLLEVGAHRHDVLAYHVALLGVPFAVRAPEELRAHVQVMAERLTAAAQGTSTIA